MSIFSKVLLGFVMIAAFGLFYVSLRMVKTWAAWRSKAVQHEQELDYVDAQILKARDGEEGTPSIASLRSQLYAALVNRGRAWSDVRPNVNQDGSATATIDNLTDGEIAAKSVLYAFEMPAAGAGNYLGEFEVTAVNGQQVSLRPTILRQEDQRQLAASQGPWRLYEKMPSDGYELLAGADAGELQQMLPPEMILEFTKHGKPPTPGDPPSQVVMDLKFLKDFGQLSAEDRNLLQQLEVAQDVVLAENQLPMNQIAGEQLVQAGIAEELGRYYQRPLRDFSVLFREFQRQIPVLRDSVAAMRKELGYIQTSVQISQNKESRDKELIAELTTERDRLLEEVAAMNGFKEELDKDLAKYQTNSQVLLKENARLAQELADKQLKAQRKIDQATMAGLR